VGHLTGRAGANAILPSCQPGKKSVMETRTQFNSQIPSEAVTTALKELEILIGKEIADIDERICMEYQTAPQEYIKDMQGFSRGMMIMGGKCLHYLRKKLLSQAP
jgi:hypothetical protein